MNNINNFIEKFRKRFNDEQEIKSVFTNGYCYHFAYLLAGLYEGFISYNPVDNHFGFVESKTNSIWDITGNIGEFDNNSWRNWEEYKSEEPIESSRIIKQCIYKIYEEME